jgi:hypothetical protein
MRRDTPKELVCPMCANPLTVRHVEGGGYDAVADRFMVDEESWQAHCFGCEWAGRCLPTLEEVIVECLETTLRRPPKSRRGGSSS